MDITVGSSDGGLSDAAHRDAIVQLHGRSRNCLHRRVCLVSSDCGTPSMKTCVTCVRWSMTSPVVLIRFAPGEEIPRIYFDFVRRRDGRAMARVLEHNRTARFEALEREILGIIGHPRRRRRRSEGSPRDRGGAGSVDGARGAASASPSS